MIIAQHNLLKIIKSALNIVNDSLIDHGDRVAFIVEMMLRQSKNASEEKISFYYEAALLHDMGAYKTDDVDDTLMFDSVGVWEHSIYGYLFVKYFSPLSSYADGIKYHHINFDKYPSDVYVPCKELASYIRLADSVDLALQSGTDFEDIRRFAVNLAGRSFDPRLCTLFLETDKRLNLLDNVKSGEYKSKSQFSFGGHISYENAISYLRMMALTIDFHSEVTALHTIAVENLSRRVAEMMGFSKSDTEKISIGALIHDIGKIAIPVSILEKPSFLTNEEMKIMQKHVVYTDEIIKPYIDDDIRKIAVRHHERLDGTGYPAGLSDNDLSFMEKIVAVADVTSALHAPRSYKEPFSQEVIIKELKNQAKHNKLSREAVDFFCDNYDELNRNLQMSFDETTKIYKNIQDEYSQLLNNFKKGNYFI